MSYIKLLLGSAFHLRETDFMSMTALNLAKLPVKAPVLENRAADAAVVKADVWQSSKVFLRALRKRSKTQHKSLSSLRKFFCQCALPSLRFHRQRAELPQRLPELRVRH